MNSHCEWGFCECDYGMERRFGQCGRIGSMFTPRSAKFDPFVTCSTIATCQVFPLVRISHGNCSTAFLNFQAIDINMVCNTKLTVQSGGKCQCKEDMKWNEATGECQVESFNSYRTCKRIISSWFRKGLLLL